MALPGATLKRLSRAGPYNAIIHPLRPRMSHRKAIAWILSIWTLSSSLAMPNAIYSVVQVGETGVGSCAMTWPDGRYPLSSYDHIYNISVLIVTYLVPILTMTILYYKVGKELWGSETIGENIEKQQRAILAKKKIVKMMIVVVIIFALCWLPYHGFFVVNYYSPIFSDDLPYQRCYLMLYWLAMSNSMYNPIIIYFMNSKFRHEFRRVLCMLFCCRQYVPPIKIDHTTTEHTCAPQNNTRTRSPIANSYNIANANNSNNKATETTKHDADQPFGPKGRSGVIKGTRLTTTNSNNNIDTNDTNQTTLSLIGSSAVLETEGNIGVKASQTVDCGGANIRPQPAGPIDADNTCKPVDSFEQEPFLASKSKLNSTSTGSSPVSSSTIDDTGNRTTTKRPDESKVWI